jgi:hypothetical protein
MDRISHENKALKEIEESSILTEYLLYHGLSLDDIKHFSTRMVRRAVEWKRSEVDKD